MALSYPMEGTDMFGFIKQGSAKVRLNCINKMSIKFDTDENEIVCDGFAGFKKYLPSLKSATLTLSGVYQKADGDDAATNWGWDNAFDSQKAQTIEEIYIAPNSTNGTMAIVIKGFIKSSSLDFESKKPTPYQLEFRVVEEPVKAALA